MNKPWQERYTGAKIVEPLYFQMPHAKRAKVSYDKVWRYVPSGHADEAD